MQEVHESSSETSLLTRDELLAVRDQHIEHLQKELEALADQAQKYESMRQELESLRQEYVAYINSYQRRAQGLQQTIHRWQQDYEQLRLQKGGFGFKALIASSLVAALTGLAISWLYFRASDKHLETFLRFRTAAGFHIEYAVGQRQFEGAEKMLQEQISNGKNDLIQPELEYIGGLIGSAKRAFEATGGEKNTVIGFSLTPPKEDTSTTRFKPQRKLIVLEDGVKLFSEAALNATVLALLNKRDPIQQWDKTVQLEKVKITHKLQKGAAEDYWYEVETKAGIKGWVFGFYTNASLNRFQSDTPPPSSPDSLPSPAKPDSLNRG
jgi:hypothetical protein